ncbi:aminotransferase-like domain-containing protein [Streptomyces sp. NPDC004752]
MPLPYRPARYNVDDRRDADSPAFMTGTLPPKVPDVFDPILRRAVDSVLGQFTPMDLIGSHQYRGAERDQAAAARFVARRFPQPPDLERMVVTNGTQSALMMLMSGLVGRGGVLAVEELSYPPVKVFADTLGIRLVPVPIDAEGMLPDAFAGVCAAHAPRAVYTMPSLHNPTTGTMSVERRQSIAETCRRYGVQVIEDDIYGVLPPSSPPALSSFAPELAWYIVGTAKCIAPGLKIAYVVGPGQDETGARFWPGVRATYWMAAPLNAAVATELVETGRADEIIQAVREEIAWRQERVAEALADADYRATSHSPHVWLSLPPALPRGEFVQAVLKLGAEIGASDQFALTPDVSVPNAVRFGVGGPRTRETFTAGLDAVATAHQAN